MGGQGSSTKTSFHFKALGSLVALLLGGSWVVISGVRSKVTILITLVRGLITPLITTHEPPSTTLRLHATRALAPPGRRPMLHYRPSKFSELELCNSGTIGQGKILKWLSQCAVGFDSTL